MKTFWNKVEKTDSCWLWTGSNNGNGYGEIRIKGIKHYTHRLSYEWAKGKIPAGNWIDHLCRTHACCNPDHLEAVTPSTNCKRGNTGKAGRKTHCINGHDYAIYEYKRKDGKGRNCSECVRNNARAYQRRKRAELIKQKRKELDEADTGRLQY